MGSVLSKEASVLKAPYVTAKHGPIGLAKAVAKEGAARNFKCTRIASLDVEPSVATIVRGTPNPSHPQPGRRTVLELYTDRTETRLILLVAALNHQAFGHPVQQFAAQISLGLAADKESICD
jgi:NAD(P)-dependent dehydrogenase (short-subunit alcohol dehydrogenase family)